MNETLLIGDKNDFAIEFRVEQRCNENLMGYARIWFGSNFIGSLLDYIFLEAYLLRGLERIAKSPSMDMEGSPEEIHHFLEKNLELGMKDEKASDMARSFLVFFGTLSDCYTIFSYTKGEDLHIVWRLHDNTYFDDLKEQDTTAIYSHAIAKSHYIELLSEMNKFVGSAV